jgi:G:T/U-mismatch repair DNA glycosylase
MANSYSYKKPYTFDLFEIEDHPFETFVKPNATHLIIGTFPTHIENRKFRFYYSGEDNLFWKVLEKIFEHKFKYYEGEIAETERKKFLESKGIGITDMLLKCYRKNKWSTDENLYPILWNDIFEILDENKLISTLVLTSRSKICGALGLLETLFIQKSIDFEWPNKRKDKILQGSFKYNDREYRVFVPYSPSPRLIKDGITSLIELEFMYAVSFKN